MKLFSAILLGFLTVLGVSSSAYGQQEMRRGRDFAQGRGSGGMHRLLPGRNEPSRVGTGQQAIVDPAPGQPETEQKTTPQPFPGQGREHMSAEERQQLRRDINAAGREIYRQTRSE